MAKKKGKAVKAAVKKNIRPLSISLFAVLLIMLAIPMGVNALDQQVVSTSDEAIVRSLSFNDADFLYETTMFDVYGINDTSENNIIMMKDNTTLTPYLAWDNIDWVGSGVTRIVITVQDYTSTQGLHYLQVANTPNLKATQGDFVIIKQNPFPGPVVEINLTYLDRVIYNQYDYIKFGSGTSDATSIPNESFMAFTIDIYGIEDPIVPMNMLSDYVALFAGIGLCGAALFATPWLQVSDISASVKKAAKRKGGKRK